MYPRTIALPGILCCTWATSVKFITLVTSLGGNLAAVLVRAVFRRRSSGT